MHCKGYLHYFNPQNVERCTRCGAPLKPAQQEKTSA